MRLVLKILVAVVPVLLVVGLLRLCEGDSGRRWLARVHEVDPDLVIAIEQPELLAIAPDQETGAAAGAMALLFRDQLVQNYGDLLGRGVDRRMVVVVFSDASLIGEFGGRNVRVDRRSLNDVIGLTQADRNAIYLPPGTNMDTLKHEVVHLLMGQSVEGRVRFSPWLSEGLAQYFESYRPPEPAKLAAEYKAFLRAKLGGGEVGVQRLVMLEDKDEFLQDARAENYLRSLILVAYLMEMQPRDRMLEYIAGEKAPRGNRYELFTSIFGPPANLEPDIARFLR
ncbi:MAG: DUF1570 domain-containing protein [Planctomycetota bacterium]|jgi:hypothetical protein